MESTSKTGTLMDCEGCNELLADFLLDELPESEAVLVHEHLLICPACMKAYRELKGTGRALEAVPSMRAIEGSENFKQEVRVKAQEELDKIVAKLPPEKRLRLEARREARQSLRILAKRPPTKVWSPGLLVLALAGAAVLAAILFWPKHEKPAPRVALGSLTVAMGKVEEFYAREKQTYSPAAEGKNILPGDDYKTGEQGRARFDLLDGSSIFMGPASEVAFRIPTEAGSTLVIGILNGEIGLLREDISAEPASKKFHDWEIRSEAGNATISAGSHVYARFVKTDKGSTLEVAVLAGSVRAVSKDGAKTDSVYAGKKVVLTSVDSGLRDESLVDDRPPAWRTDLANEADLAPVLAGKARIISRRNGQLQVELSYTHQSQSADWVAELAGSTLVERNGALSCPTGMRLKHVALFSLPLTFELKLNPESRRDTSFAFGALESPGTGVAVDVAQRKSDAAAPSGEATLTVQEKGKLPRRDRISARNQPGGPERLLLEIKADNAGYAALLNSMSGKTKSIPIWKDKADAPGDLWIQALGEGILLDEIKITGTLSAEWLRDKLGGAQ